LVDSFLDHVCRLDTLQIINVRFDANSVCLKMPVTFTVTGADYAPEDLHDQTPLKARLIRQIPGPDRPDYWLAELDRPVTWRRGSTERRITHLVVCSRHEGTVISEDMAGLLIGIAYVTDQSVLEDEVLDFGKCQYVAIGTADTIDA